MYGIIGLKTGGKGRHGAHAKYVAGPSAYKTGSRKGTAAGDKGDKKSQKTTAKELNRMIKSGDLDRLVTQGHQDQGYRSGISSPSTVIGGMTKKQQDFINRNRRKDGSLNSAAQVVLDFYSDGRSDYQRDLDKFIKSSPEARDAYLDRFPIGGALNLGIPAAFNALAPAPIKMLGKVAKAARSIPELLQKTGMGKDLAFEYNKAKKSLEPAKQALIDLATKKGILNTTDAKNMEINQRLKTPLGDELKKENIGLHSETPIEEKIYTSLPDSPAVGDLNILKDLEGKIIENELANYIEDVSRQLQTKPESLVYDPEKDRHPGDDYRQAIWHGQSGPYEIEDWMGTVQPGLERANKLAHIERATGQNMSTYSDGHIDATYNMLRSHEEKGEVWDQQSGEWQAKPTAGTIDLTTQEDIFNIGGDQSIDPQDNIITGFADQPLTQTKEVYADGTPYYGKTTNDFNVGSFPAMNIFGTEVKGPRSLALDAINTYGNTLSASEKEAFDILNSLGQADGGYLKQYDDGGYANMSTFEKLKAIADSHYG
jgi:hypothetical protein